MSKLKYLQIIMASFFYVHCTHVPKNTKPEREPNAVLITKNISSQKAHKDWLQELPGEGKSYVNSIKRLILRNKKNKLTATELDLAATRIAKYVGFIMTNFPDHSDEKPKDSLMTDAEFNLFFKKTVSNKLILRLLQSSVQFILCPNLEDFSCLEKNPLIIPSVTYREENPASRLDETVEIQDSFEKNSEYYFNTQIFTPEDQYNPDIGVAKILENKIRGLKTNSDKDGLYMAVYGVDDNLKTDKTTGSLGGVYSAIIDRIDAGTPVQGVFDQIGPQKSANKPLIFSYTKPDSNLEKNWILSPLNNPNTEDKTQHSEATNLNFQYNGGTQGLIKKLSENIKSETESKGRIEWPDTGIMHNKFFIFKEDQKFSVWTGTANISRTCLGTERNSNLSVLIKNDDIAKSYLSEFQEMYEFQDFKNLPPIMPKDFIGSDQQKFVPRGRFHLSKTPNTKRYFKFLKDQTDLRLYFSPTDDAEHRALLPMLLSAKPGDQILISMFGAAVIEYVRALQWVAARGVKVQIIVDSPTACSSGSWAGRSGDATLLENNPYKKLIGNNLIPIELRKNDKATGETWKQNHQKIGLLLRKKTNGILNPEYITFGSQNWSESGNDRNDENLIILRKTNGALKLGSAFEDHFKNFLWPKALSIPQTGCADMNDTVSADGL